MSPLLLLVASAVIGFAATRTARRHARRYEERFLSPRLRARRLELASSPDAPDADDYAAATLASLEDELRAVRGGRAPSLYTPGEARRARAAMAPMYGVTMRVKP